MRRSRRDTIELGEELARARRTCGATQAEVARLLSWSPSKVRRIERGQRASVTHLELACFASVVGLRYNGRMFPGGARLRDATQLKLINGYRTLAVECGWNCRIEDPIPIIGDLRAFDLMLRTTGLRVAHEFISRLYDGQAQVRPILQKQRDAGIDTLILVIKDNAENRGLVAWRAEPSTTTSRSTRAKSCVRSAGGENPEAIELSSGAASQRQESESARRPRRRWRAYAAAQRR